jgi:hypothetical protein
MGGDTTNSQASVYAVEPGDGSSIVFNYEVNGVEVNTVTKSFAELTADTDMTPWKYLAWDGSAYKVYGVDIPTGAAISIDARSGIPSGTTLVSQLGALWSKTVTYGTVRFKQADGTVKEYSANDIQRRTGFPKDATSEEVPESPTFDANQNGGNSATGSQAFITLSAKATEITGNDKSNDVTGSTPVNGLTLCTNLDARDPSTYEDPDTQMPFASRDERYKKMGDMPQNIVEITFVNDNTFKVFSQVGDNAKVEVKPYTDDQLADISTTGKIGFLQFADNAWNVHATDKYVKIADLIKDAGLVFNAGDKLLVRANDGFSYTPSYNQIQTEKYFFGGITDTNIDIGNPTEVGAVLALKEHYANSAPLNGSASATLPGITITSGGFNNGGTRFYIGLSDTNAKATTAPGNRFPQTVTSITVIKDKVDTVDNAVVTLEKDSYTYTGAKIAPVVTSVTLDGVALVSEIDYTVSYGTNTVAGTGTVTVTGKSLPGATTKNFTITPITIADADVTLASTSVVETGTQIKPEVTVKSGTTTLTTADYDVTYGANKAVGKGTVTVTGKGNYTGTVTKEFTITVDQKKVAAAQKKAESVVKKLVPPVKNTTVKVAKKAVTVKIKAVKGATKYTLRYKVKGTKKWKTKTITVKQAKAGYKIKSLKKGKKYEIQYSVTKKAGVAKKSVASKWSKSKVTAKVK